MLLVGKCTFCEVMELTGQELRRLGFGCTVGPSARQGHWPLNLGKNINSHYSFQGITNCKYGGFSYPEFTK